VSEMIERVAKALCRGDLKEGGDFDAAWEQESAVWLSEARAAIEAMREPNIQMLEAGADEEYGVNDHGGAEWCADEQGALLVWHAMIDEALAQGGDSLPPRDAV